MNRFYFLALSFVLMSHFLSAQIDMRDSTVQVVAYWGIGEKQHFSVYYQAFQTHEADTLVRMLIKYDVDVVIKDSSAHHYEFEWIARNLEVDSQYPHAKAFASVAENINFIIKTDEFGKFQELLNWEQVRAEGKAQIAQLMEEISEDQEVAANLKAELIKYQNQSSIEDYLIDDIKQFCKFHGYKFKLQEKILGEVDLPSQYGEGTIQKTSEAFLEEIYLEDDNYVLRMHEALDSEQLTQANYQRYLLETADTLAYEAFPKIEYDTWTGSRIHGSSAWVIYSVETRAFRSDDIVDVEERIIEIK